MMKYSLIVLFLFCGNVVPGQTAIINETPVQTVNRIFTAFMAQNETSEIPENRVLMGNALIALRDSADKKDFGILINTWLYYNPPTFPTRKLIEPILFKDKVAAIEKINELLIQNDTYAGKNSAPGSDLIKLRDKIYRH